jgi:predicted metal-binding protein/ubiquinone/menaquinone biosynthesis C-methylase UbiE
MMNLPHLKANIASDDFQILEDLATGAWYSEVLFAALELGVFEILSSGPCLIEDAAGLLKCEVDALARLMAALSVLGLIVATDGKYENAPLASRYLTQRGESFAGDFLDYRRILAPNWNRLASRIREGVRVNDRPIDESQESYEERVFTYVRAMDFQARIKAADAAGHLALLADIEPRLVLDIGGGAGAWCRAILEKWPQAHAVLLDLPETLSAARKLYPDILSWKGIETVAGNGLTPCFREQKFDLIILSNILHAYGASEANQLLIDAARSLAPGGMVLIHDYLTDGHRSSPFKGRLYDLHMMLNTYNGRIYSFKELQAMLDAAGLANSRLLHLGTDTSILLASKDTSTGHLSLSGFDMIEAHAGAFGFDFARIIGSSEIIIEPWVRIKCEFGCSRHGASLNCPPHSPDEEKMKRILSGYTHALLVQSTPPGRQFHERLLELEKFLFINGHPEALAFGAGPCPMCPECPPDGQCRFPKIARPSLEACGVDVYETARRAGLWLEPIRHRDGYIRYVGLVLFKERKDHAYSINPGDFNPEL